MGLASERINIMTTSSLSPELLVPRLGQYLVEKGLIKPEDLSRALEYQAELRAQGKDRLIGQVLIDLGIIDIAMREAIITEQLQELKTNLQEANEQLLDANQQLERRVQQRTAELQRAMEKLAEVSQLKANIVANISHELRTPLTHLKGYMELLLTGDMGPLTEQQQAALGIMERSSERLGRLIEDLLMFSLSEKEKLHLHLAPFSIQDLCVSSLHKTNQKAKDRNIKMVLDCHQGIPAVDGDVEKISWVVLQFLDNAIKFTQSGGTVTLRTDLEDRMVRISVMDTGIGIPETRIDEMFDSFHQLDGSSTRRAGGTGLGLALAKKIVEAHGSIIQVSSDVGKGSCFSFALKVH
jgi:signal transduction histidine kinase